MNIKKFINVLILVLTVSCVKDKEAQTWQKGNIHTHSLWSDGDDFPEMIIQWYKDHNYQIYRPVRPQHRRRHNILV